MNKIFLKRGGIGSENSSSLTPFISKKENNQRDVGKARRFILQRFRQDICGAITVDFVVLTAAILLIATSAVMQIKSGTTESTKDIKKCMKIQGKLLSKNKTYKKKLQLAQKRCGKL